MREQERAAKLAEKGRQKALRDAEKAIQLSQKGKRKASQASKPPRKRQKRVVDVPSHIQAGVAAQPTPPKRSKTRLIQLNYLKKISTLLCVGTIGPLLYPYQRL
jgi:hypothetical protein